MDAGFGLSHRGGDRFIPNRSASDLDYGRSVLTMRDRNMDYGRSVYREVLSRVMNMDRERKIFSFKERRPPRKKLPSPLDEYDYWFGDDPVQLLLLGRRRRKIPRGSERTLSASSILDDLGLNLLDWGSRNVLAVALGNTVYLRDSATGNGSASELVTVDESDGPVTSIAWAPDGDRLAIGLNSSEVQLWDCNSNHRLKTFTEMHEGRVGSLAWNGNDSLTTGAMDGTIVNNDVRMLFHVTETYRGHCQQVCSLKWSSSGKQLASGGYDKSVYIWDVSMASAANVQNQKQWLHCFGSQMSAVKALAWCPFKTNLLASGADEFNGCINFWNTESGSCVNSINTRSGVCSLLWSKNDRELLSSHGFPGNHLTLWKYPSLAMIEELTDHTSSVLYMTQSPDGCMVATASGDETVRLWKVFAEPELVKPAIKRATRPFQDVGFIR